MAHMVPLLCGWYLRFLNRREGQALVEYTLILVLASIVAVAAVTGLGNTIVTKLYGLSTSF